MVGVMDKMDINLPLYSFQRHFQSRQRTGILQCGTYAPTNDFLCVGVQDERKIAEDIMAVIDISDTRLNKISVGHMVVLGKWLI